MSVPLATRTVRYVASGGQTVFPYPWLALAATDFVVTRLRDVITTTLVLNIDYAVTGIGSPTGGNIELTVGAAAGDIIAIDGAQPVTRTSDFADSGDLRAKALNAELDRLVIAQQQLDAARLRSLRVPATDSASGTELAPAVIRKNTVLGFDSTGAIVLYPSTPALAPPGAVFVDARASYGAVGDDVTDNTTALQAAAHAAATIGGVLVIPDGAYRITGTLVLPGAAAGLVMHGELVKVGAGIALILGDGGAVRNGEKFYSNIRVRRATQSNWASEDDIGVLARNLDRSWLHVAEARGFTIGLRTLGDQRGFEDTTIVLGALIDNKIGLDIRTATASAWNNGVRYIGGHFAVSSGTNAGQSTVGVRISREAGAYNNHNSHTFVAPDFELAQAGRAEAVPFLVETSGRGLHALGVRMEQCKPYVARHTGAMRDALYEVIFNSPDSYLVDVAYDATATRAGAVVRPLHAASGQQQHHRMIAAVENVRARAFRSSAGNTGFEGLSVIGGSSGSWLAVNLNGAGDAGWTLGAETVTILTGNRGLAFPVRTLSCRDFVLGLGGDDGLRPVVRLFDAAGNLLDSTAHRVLGSEQTFEWSASPGWWQASAGLSDGSLNRQVHVRLEGPDIAYAQIGIARIGADQVVRAMSLACDPRFRPQVLTGAATGWGTREIPFSFAYDPPSIAGGATQAQNITVTDAVPGDHVQVGFSLASTAILWLATIGATNTVTVVAWNRSGTAIDLGAGTLFGQVLKPRV